MSDDQRCGNCVHFRPGFSKPRPIVGISANADGRCGVKMINPESRDRPRAATDWCDQWKARDKPRVRVPAVRGAGAAGAQGG